MKKPPDVIVIETKQLESPIYKWIKLLDWAKKNKDDYLYERAKSKILTLITSC